MILILNVSTRYANFVFVVLKDAGVCVWTKNMQTPLPVHVKKNIHTFRAGAHMVSKMSPKAQF